MYSGEIRGDFKHIKSMTGLTCVHSFIRLRSGGTMDDNSLGDSNVKVAVRVRPMNRRGEYNVGQTL